MDVPGCDQSPQWEAALAGASSSFLRLRLSAGHHPTVWATDETPTLCSALGLTCWRRMKDSTYFPEGQQPALWASPGGLPCVLALHRSPPACLCCAWAPSASPLSSNSTNRVRSLTHLFYLWNHLQPFIYHELKWSNFQSIFDTYLHITFSSLKAYVYFLFLKKYVPLRRKKISMDYR